MCHQLCKNQVSRHDKTCSPPSLMLLTSHLHWAIEWPGHGAAKKGLDDMMGGVDNSPSTTACPLCNCIHRGSTTKMTKMKQSNGMLGWDQPINSKASLCTLTCCASDSTDHATLYHLLYLCPCTCHPLFICLFVYPCFPAPHVACLVCLLPLSDCFC